MAESDSNLAVEGFVTLQLPCRYSYLRMIRQSVQDMCVRAGLSEFKSSQLEMAVDEACANVIEHSYGGEAGAAANPNHPGLRINLMQCKDRLVVEVIDKGTGFEFNTHKAVEPQAYLDENRQRGLGMFIIHRFVDEATYDRDTPTGNRLRLTKLL